MLRLTRLIAALALLLAAAPAFAQSPPLPFDGVIRIVCPYPAGGSSDVLARLVAEKMQAALGRSVIVENRTGAGGRIAAEYMKTVPADGSQILLANTVIMVLNPLVEKVGYDPVADFAPLARAGDYQIPLVTGPMTGAKDFKSLVAWLKSNPDKANYGVPAPGSLPHLYGLQLARAADLKLVMVPFRGGAPIATAILGGQIATGLSAAADFAEQHRAGSLHIVAFSGKTRAPTLPDVPTFDELGLKGFEDNGWNGFFAPAGTPAAVVTLYNRLISEAVRASDVAERLGTLGFLVTTSTPEELGRQIVAEREKFRPLLEEAGVLKP